MPAQQAMRALTSVLERAEVGQAQVCRAPPEDRLASSRAQSAASVSAKQLLHGSEVNHRLLSAAFSYLTFEANMPSLFF